MARVERRGPIQRSVFVTAEEEKVIRAGLRREPCPEGGDVWLHYLAGWGIGGTDEVRRKIAAVREADAR